MLYTTLEQKVSLLSLLHQGLKTRRLRTSQRKSVSTVDQVNRVISFPSGPWFKGNPQIARNLCIAYSCLISQCLRGILQENLFNEIIACFAHKL